MTRFDLKMVANNKEPQPAKVSPRADDARYSQAAVGHRLRVARITLGFPESKAAAACKVSLTTYRKWEAGGAQRNCYKQLSRLAKKFDVSLAWLAADAGDPPSNSADGKIAFLSVKPSRGKTSHPGICRTLTSQELGSDMKP
jgi:transcriptional regulator with XRE-family HTH domain